MFLIARLGVNSLRLAPENPAPPKRAQGGFGDGLFHSASLTVPSRKAVTNPQEVSMLSETIAESLENILSATS